MHHICATVSHCLSVALSVSHICLCMFFAVMQTHIRLHVCVSASISCLSLQMRSQFACWHCKAAAQVITCFGCGHLQHPGVVPVICVLALLAASCSSWPLQWLPCAHAHHSLRAGNYGGESWIPGVHSWLDHASRDHLWLSLLA